MTQWVMAWVAGYAAAAALAARAVFAGETLEAGGGWLFLDALSAFFLAVMAFVFLLSSAYCVPYFAADTPERALAPRIARRFGALWAGALFSMTLVLLSNNLAVMWVGIELTTLSTAFLIRLRVTRESLEATWKYLVVCSVGVALAFMGVVLVAAAARGVLPDAQDALMWRSLMGVAGDLDPGLVKAGFLFILVGFGTKAGIAPMHTWLPDAHSQAPAPVSAVFSGTLLNAGLYCVMRYLPLVEGVEGGKGFGPQLLVAFGLVSVCVAAAFIVFQRDLKRLLAYSSVEHIGVIALGLGLGPAGTFAALFHALNHSTAKAVGFYSAGRLDQALGGHELAHLRGAAARCPLWGRTLVVSLLALVGAAPFAIFLSEFLVLQAAAAAGAWWAALILLFGLAVAFAGVLRHLMGLGWADGGTAPPAAPTKVGWAEGALAIVPLAVLLVLGLWMPSALRGAVEAAAAVLGGGA